MNLGDFGSFSAAHSFNFIASNSEQDNKVKDCVDIFLLYSVYVKAASSTDTVQN